MNKFKKLLLASSIALVTPWSAALSVKAQDKIEIEYWHMNADTQGGQTVASLVEAFNNSQDEIHVTAVFNEGSYPGIMQNMQTTMAGGQHPDVVQIGYQYLDYFSNNFPYTDPISLIGENGLEEDANFLEEKFAENVVALGMNAAGELVGFPYAVSNPVLYINLDLFEEAGITEDPTTWDEVRETAKAIKEATGKYGLHIDQGSWINQAIIESNGARTLTDGQATFASEEGKEALQFWHDLIQVDQVAPLLTAAEGRQAFVQGEFGMMFATIAQRTNVIDNSNFNAKAIVAPAFGDNEQRLPAGGNVLTVVSQDDEKKAAALEFIKFLFQEENLLDWSLGTGYVPHTLNSEENEVMADFLANDSVMPAGVAQMDKVVPWVSFPGNAGLEADALIGEMQQLILSGGGEVSETMDNFQDQINLLINE